MKSLIQTIVLTGILLSASAWSQQSDSWDWRVIPYLWGVNIDGTMQIGPIEGDMDTSFSDILSDMDFGGAIYAEMGKGPNSFHFDYTYLRLKPNPNELPSPPFAPGSELKQKMTVNLYEQSWV